MMKLNFSKLMFVLMLSSSFLVSCNNDDDSNTPVTPPTPEEMGTVEVKIEHPAHSTEEASNTEFTYFSFEKKQLAINNETAKNSLDWDIAFLTTAGRTNSGTSGMGKAQVFMTLTEDFDGIKSASEFVEQEDMWKIDEQQKNVMLFKMPVTNVTDNFNPYLINWYTMDTSVMPPNTTTNKRVFIIRTAKGDKYVKFQFISPYGVDGNGEAGNLRFRYEFIPLNGEPNTAKRVNEIVVSGNESVSKAIAAEQAATTEYLIVENTMTQADFDFLKKSMPKLVELDLTNATLNVDFYEYLLKDNKTIKKLIMPKNLEFIGQGWLGYTNIEEVIFQPNSLKRIGDGAFSLSQKLKKVVLPDSLESIENNAFYACVSLESIVVPENVIIIPDNCFYYCRELKYVELKGKVRTLGAAAFGSCEKLGEIKFHSTEAPTYNSYPFGGIKNEDFFFSVPKGSVDSYLSTWPGFTEEYRDLFHEF